MGGQIAPWRVYPGSWEEASLARARALVKSKETTGIPNTKGKKGGGNSTWLEDTPNARVKIHAVPNTNEPGFGGSDLVCAWDMKLCRVKVPNVSLPSPLWNLPKDNKRGSEEVGVGQYGSSRKRI